MPFSCDLCGSSLNYLLCTELLNVELFCTAKLSNILFLEDKFQHLPQNINGINADVSCVLFAPYLNDVLFSWLCSMILLKIQMFSYTELVALLEWADKAMQSSSWRLRFFFPVLSGRN